MREGCGVEVELHIVLLSPVHPAAEMFRCHLVPVHSLPLEVAVDFVEIEPVGSRNQGLCLYDILSELIDISRFPWIVSCNLDSAGEARGQFFKSSNVICLPAMQGKMKILHCLQDFVCVNADVCITFLCDFVRLVNQFFFHIFIVILFLQ